MRRLWTVPILPLGLRVWHLEMQLGQTCEVVQVRFDCLSKRRVVLLCHVLGRDYTQDVPSRLMYALITSAKMKRAAEGRKQTSNKLAYIFWSPI